LCFLQRSALFCKLSNLCTNTYEECSTKLSTGTAIFFVFEKLKAARIEWQEKFEVFRGHRKENALIEKMADINFWLN